MTKWVVIEWRECVCPWRTKFCDMEHVKQLRIPRRWLGVLIEMGAQ